MPSALLLYHFLHPDDVVSAQLLTGLATGLSKRGWRVDALCSNRACHDDSAHYPRHSTHEGIKITRLWRPNFRQSSAIGRTANTAWMLAAWALHILRRRPAPDAVIIGTDPPLSILLAPIVKRIWPRTKVAHWCFDLYPEAAIADGVLNHPNALLHRAMRASYRACDLIADIGPCMRSLLAQYGSPARAVTLTPWALEEPPQPLPICLDERLSLFAGAPLALLYSGTLGRAHALEPVLDLARLLSGSGAHFAFTARGNRTRQIPSSPNVTVGMFASHERLQDRLAAPDIHIVTLKEEWTGTVVPSKFFGALAVGRPVLFVGSPDSAIATWIREYQVGWVMHSSNRLETARALRELAGAPSRLPALFAHCHTVYRREFSKSVTLDKWDAELRSFLPSSGPCGSKASDRRTEVSSSPRLIHG